jgi:hypothetical protein
LAGTFSKTIWRELFKKHLAGTFKNNIWREQKKTFGGNILAGTFWRDFFLILFRKLYYKILLFENKGSETQP